MTPPVFADVNGDSFGDMIFCTIGGELVAVNGAASGTTLWKFKVQKAECARYAFNFFFASFLLKIFLLVHWWSDFTIAIPFPILQLLSVLETVFRIMVIAR